MTSPTYGVVDRDFLTACDTYSITFYSCETGVSVQAVESRSSGGATVRFEGGKSVTARRAVVVATDGPAAQQLLGKAITANPSKPEAGVGTCCLYFR